MYESNRSRKKIYNCDNAAAASLCYRRAEFLSFWNSRTVNGCDCTVNRCNHTGLLVFWPEFLKACSSTSSLSYQRQLSTFDYLNISETFSKLTKKWKLKTGRMVEDVMYKASKEFIVKHPAHSFILNTEDSVWEETFSQSELDEIAAAANSFDFNKPFPPDLQGIKLKLNKKGHL
ncbi:uncharacterized protein EV154DRAFT_287958 [Mucor mucedo]|uniref:uncharacterized protein n=1 Tax=Mucor mucedo TaxID=29922 RepID=UPI002220C2A0|nr:uncharacterized protein EV154DRAFT_287958 [Mucor mucedo]KAI7889219.1 hypothetical protein EV154DRAFT_287958 [Mucor mucedo]